MYRKCHWLLILHLIAVACCETTIAFAADYDPLVTAADSSTEPLDTVVKDAKRSRELPIRVYLPAVQSAAPVVLFSHGLGGSREGSAYLGKHWASRGYVVVYIQHPGSDDSVWRNKRIGQRMNAMREAASLHNFLLRAADVSFVLDELERWNASEEHDLAGRLNLDAVGMSGHSFGAVTTQAVSGQRYVRGVSATDPRIKAAIAFSPSGPRQGNAAQAFGSVKIPWMLMTGTNDVALIGETDVKSRLSVFPALPPGGKYELVLDNAEHSAFTDRPLPGDKQKRNPNHHRVILALSTAFWDAYLQDNSEAKAWLDGDGPRTVLEANDRWQKK
jgi:predicted dienelactone hydrolase